MNKSAIEGVMFEVIIPKHRNDKTPISEDRINYYRNKIVEFAGGLSEIDTRGVWIGNSKQIDSDVNLTIQVFIPEVEINTTDKYLRLLCKQMALEFGQEQVMLKKQGATVEFIEGKRDESTPKKTKKDRIIAKKELQHYIVMLLEELIPGSRSYFDLLEIVKDNAKRYGIDIGDLNPKKELEYLIGIKYIQSASKKSRAYYLDDPSKYKLIDNPTLSLTLEGRKFYFNSDIKCKLQE